MIRRALVLLALGSVLGVFFATLLGPQPASGEEAPAELKAAAALPTRSAKDISKPIVEATRKVRPAVVQILTFRRLRDGRLQYRGSGSGFVISKQGHVLTNHHVVEQGTIHVIEAMDGHRFQKVELLGADPRSDVAVLRIKDLEGRKLSVATLGDSDALDVGEIVVAIGAPYNLDASVSMGIVSATGRTGLLGRNTSEEFIQTDAALNSGNSGGPMINLDGQVVGVNTAIRREGGYGGNIGIGFAVPINLARTVAVALIEHGVAERGHIGIYFDPTNDVLTNYTLKKQGIDAQGGIRVGGVERDSPAEDAGLETGDIVTAVDDRPLTDIRLLHARLAQAGAGGTVKLTVYRGTTPRRVNVRLARGVTPSYGIEVSTLSQAEARSLGLKPATRGAVVTRLREGSVAAQTEEKKRLRTGDVIVRVAWHGRHYAITSKQDFDKAMAAIEMRPPRVVEFIIVTKDGAYRAQVVIPTGRS